MSFRFIRYFVWYRLAYKGVPKTIPFLYTKFKRLFDNARLRFGLPLLTFSLPILKTSEEITPDQKLRKLFQQALIHLSKEQFQAASDVFHDILHELQDQRDAGELTEREFVRRRGRIYAEMANIGLMDSDPLKAETLLLACIKDCITAGLDESDPIIIEISLKLAILYEELGQPEKAQLGYQFILHLQEEKMAQLKEGQWEEEDRKNDEALLGMILNYYAKFLHANERTPKAIELGQRALTLARSLYGPNNGNVVHLLNDLAVMHIYLGKWEIADILLNEALEICENAPSGLLLQSLIPLYVNKAQLLVERDGRNLELASERDKLLQIIQRWCQQAEEVAKTAEFSGLLRDEANRCYQRAQITLYKYPVPDDTQDN